MDRVIKGQAHHQGLDPAFRTELLQIAEIIVKVASFQGDEWCDGQTKPITASQADSATTHIKTQG